MRGQHDDLEAGPAVLQFLQQADAVDLVHAQVGDHEVGAEAAGGGQRLHAVLDRLDFVVLGAQADGQQAQQARVVIDDQDAGLALGWLAGSRRCVLRWRSWRSEMCARCWRWRRAWPGLPRAALRRRRSLRSRSAVAGWRGQRVALPVALALRLGLQAFVVGLEAAARASSCAAARPAPVRVRPAAAASGWAASFAQQRARALRVARRDARASPAPAHSAAGAPPSGAALVGRRGRWR